MTDNLIAFPAPPPKTVWEERQEWTAEQWAKYTAEWTAHMLSRPLRQRCTRNTLGTAAERIIDRDVTASQIDGIIASCAWCQTPRMNHECWHQAAKLLLAHGLDANPLPQQPALFDTTEATDTAAQP
jgi:hypothetical protein